jgi:hypothetical protein
LELQPESGNKHKKSVEERWPNIEERAKEVVHCAGTPRELLEYIQEEGNQLDDCMVFEQPGN